MKNKSGTLCVLLALGMSVSITASAQQPNQGVGINRDNQAVPPVNDVNRNDRVNDPLQTPANDLNRNVDRTLNRDNQLNRDALQRDVPRPANALPRTFEGRVTAKTADSITVNGKVYRINRQTRFDRNGTLESIKVGDTIHGYLRGDGSLANDLGVASVGMGALRDRRPVRDQINPNLNPGLNDPVDPTVPRVPGVVPANPAAPGSPVQPGGPAIPRSPGQSSPAVPSAPGTPAAPSGTPSPSTPAPSAPSGR